LYGVARPAGAGERGGASRAPRPKPGARRGAGRTAIVTPDWLLALPTEITSEAGPDGVFGGIFTFTCMTPETIPGASPYHAMVAGWLFTSAATRSRGSGIWARVQAEPDAQVTLPVTPAGAVWPSPVM
jgi:hypothetical protein